MSTFYLNVELVEKKPPTKALPPGCRRQVTFIIRVPLIGKFLFGGLYLLTLLSPPLSLSLSLSVALSLQPERILNDTIPYILAAVSLAAKSGKKENGAGSRGGAGKNSFGKNCLHELAAIATGRCCLSSLITPIGKIIAPSSSRW
jgi:hypothetical protein